MTTIHQLSAHEARQHIPALAAVLVDCVAGGASVNFMAGFSQQEAEDFFTKVADGVERQERVLLAAFVDSQLVGTIQMIPAAPPNQPHRADVAKLLVQRSARGQGVATQLMRKLEEVALLAGKTLLVLDTVTGSDAERLYTNLGWTKLGTVPDYCLFPDGTLCGTTFFYKHLLVG